MDEKLFAYINQQIKRNTPKEEIIGILMDNGWDDEEIMEAFNAVIKKIQKENLQKQNYKNLLLGTETLKQSYVFSPKTETQTNSSAEIKMETKGETNKKSKIIFLVIVVFFVFCAGILSYLYFFTDLKEALLK